MNGVLSAGTYTTPIRNANNTAAAQVCGPSLRANDWLSRSVTLAAGADRIFAFRFGMPLHTIKNPEAFGLRVGVFRTESNRPSRPPIGADNHDAADNAGSGDGRLGERDNHWKPGKFCRNDAVPMQE